MLDRARTEAFSTAETCGLGTFSIQATFVSQEHRTPWEQRVLCGAVEFCVAQPWGRHCPAGPITHSTQHSWQVEKPHGVYFHEHFRDTHSSPVACTNVWLRQRHTRARPPWSSPFLLFFSVGTQKFPLPILKSTLQAQWERSSINDVHGASVGKKSRNVHFYSHAQT